MTVNGHPRLSLWGAHAVVVLLAALAAPEFDAPQASAAASAAGYRLAGTVLVGDKYLGFLELPQGGQVMVREGSVVNGGRVIAFTDKVLRIQFPDRVVELPLEGSGRPPPPDARGIVTERQDMPDGKVSLAAVDVQSLSNALHAEQSKPKVGAKPAMPNDVKGHQGPADTPTALAERFAPLFRLPPGSQIVSINDASVGTVDSAIKTVEETLRDQSVARLTIRTSSGETRLYLRPQLPKKRP